MLRRRRTNNLKKVGLLSTNIRRRISNKRDSRRLVQRRVKQIAMRLEGTTITPNES